jgi:hypothetical protein
MKRRGFLQSLAAAVAGASFPAVAAGERRFTQHAGYTFIGPEFFDYGHQTGMAMKLPDGRHIAVRMHNGQSYQQGAALHPDDERRLKMALIERARALA